MTEERVVRVSLTWLLLCLAGVFVGGMLGGFVAIWWQGPRLSALPDTQDKLVTTIQEVTISPNIATTELVAQHERSIVLLARAEPPRTPVGTGIVVTSDGVLATTAAVPEGELVMFDSTSRPIKLERVGVDELYGITYLRARGGVFVPMEVRSDLVSVGATLIALHRSLESFTPRAGAYSVEEYRLPKRGETLGWQQILQGTPLKEETAGGIPLLDEEGSVAALALPGDDGRALPSPLLQVSLKRLGQNQLEANPFVEHGFSGEYAFGPAPDGSQTFALTITAVTPGSPANIQGLRAGDVIESINGVPLTWQQGIAEILTTLPPITLQVRRGTITRIITL